MKRIQKMLAILVAMSMVFGMASAVFAEPTSVNVGVGDVTGTSSDKGTITVTGITQESGVTVKAYKIVEAEYNNNGGGFSGYKSLIQGVSVNNNGEANTKFTNEQLSAVLQNLDAYDVEEMKAQEGGSYTAVVAPGAYLIVVTGGQATIYNPMVATLYYQESAGANILVADNPTAKSSNGPTVEKTIVSSNGEDKGNTLNVGQSVTYSVEIQPIPYYGGSHPKFEVQDTLSEGLEYNADSLSVKVVKADGSEETLDAETDYILTTENTISINFVTNAGYTLNDYADEAGTNKVVITYSATLTGDAVEYNQDPNTNSVVLNYTRDSNTTGNDGSDDDETYTYTFDITGSMNGIYQEGFISKIDDSITSGSKKLPGAEFTLYKDEACTEIYSNNVFTGVARSDENGYLEIKGLAEGSYWLKETKAPADYSLNEHVIPIVITTKYNEDGTLDWFDITVDGNKGGKFDITANGVDTSDVNKVEINNTKLSSLPSTGGIGTTIFTIGGCIIMIAAAGLFFASRKKSAK